MTCLIVCEKPSAAKNFAAALGGMEGRYAGEDYKILALRGHVLEFAAPEEQVAPALSERYAKWSLDALPWNISDIAFKRVVSPGAKDVFNAAARAIKTLMAKDELVIATDMDPSGEGELLAWEVLDACGFDAARVRVTRMLFEDEAPDSIRGAFERRVGIVSKETDGDYLKAEARSRWDFCSMQLTRAATLIARERGYKGVVRAGRLKSVMVSEVGHQLDAVATYERKPFFEVRFRDGRGHVFKQEGEASQRYAACDEVPLGDFEPSDAVEDARVEKREGPGKLLDLATLSAMLAKRSFKPKEVLETYQRMYEAHVVSYPRTEDKTITPAQFDELLGIADAVASVIGVDPALLTHREPRRSHVKAQGAHGANRPGPSVPKSLDELDRFGKSAAAIYELLARSCLAMLAEDHKFAACSAHLVRYEEFKATWREEIEPGWKAIMGAPADDDDDGKPFQDDGCIAEPFAYEGCNTPPQPPTMAWLMKRLEAHEVGTGATRTSTFADVTEGAHALMTDSKGKLALTELGRVAHALLAGTRIADADATEHLFTQMEQVGRFETEMDEVVGGITKLVEHDIERMLANAEALPRAAASEAIGACPVCGDEVIRRGGIVTCVSNKSKKAADGTWENVSGCGFKVFPSFCGKKLTDKQMSKLIGGGGVALKGCTSKAGRSFDCKVRLEGGKLAPIFDEGAQARGGRR